MIQLICDNMNYWAVIVSGLAFFVVGSVWFLLLFELYSAELEKHGVKIKQPTKQQMISRLAVTLIGALITAFAVAVIVLMANSHTLVSAIKVGLFACLGFSAVTLGVSYNCEGKSLKLFLIDAGYWFIGILICAIILSLWR